jgi:hypothetical protein
MAYIALFDILGFKRAIDDLSLNELKSLMGDDFTEILSVCVTYTHGENQNADIGGSWKKHIELGDKECSFFRFSDTILFYNQEETIQSFFHVVLTSARLVAFMLLKGLPVRGAITKGELYVDTTNSLVLGEGLIRAYELEKVQQWSGALIDSERIYIPINLHSMVSDNGAEWENIADSLHLFQYLAPFKGGNTLKIKRWCLGWPILLKTMPEPELIECFSSFYPLSDKATEKELNKDAIEKRTNTVDFFKAHLAWSALQNEQLSKRKSDIFRGHNHVTCHVCDSGGIRRQHGCPGCGKHWEEWQNYE